MKRIALLFGALVVWSACTVQTEPLGEGPQGLPGEPGDAGMDGQDADNSLFMRVDGDTGTVGNLRAGDDGDPSTARLDIRGMGTILSGLNIADGGCDTPGLAQFAGEPDFSTIREGDILVDEGRHRFSITEVQDTADQLVLAPTTSNCDASGTYEASIDRATAVFRGGAIGVGTDTPNPHGRGGSGEGVHISNGAMRIDAQGPDSPRDFQLLVSGDGAYDTLLVRSEDTPHSDNFLTRVSVSGATGNVGIAALVPNARLDVRQETATSDALRIQDQAGVGGLTVATRDTGGYFVRIASANNRDLILDPHGTGYVGINTSTPQAQLDVLGAARCAEITIVGEAGGDGPVDWTLDVSGPAAEYDSLFVKSATQNEPVMVFRPNGNVGIGTSSPDALLEVASSAASLETLISSNAPELGFRDTEATHDNFALQVDGSEFRITTTSSDDFTNQAIVMNVDNSGNVVASCFQGNGGVMGTCPSDRRLKSNIHPLANTLGDVLRLKPASFEYKSKPGVRQVGLVAQDVEKVLPHLVVEDDGVKKVRYGMELQMMVLQAVKEQQEIIEAKDREIAEQRERIGELKRRLQQQEARLRAIEARLGL